jgi:hypothetical protein
MASGYDVWIAPSRRAEGGRHDRGHAPSRWRPGVDRISAQDCAGEIGEMAEAIDVCKQRMIEADRLGAEQGSEHERKAQRQKAIEADTAAFDRSVRQALGTLAAAANEMRATAASMASTAEETQPQASTVASASEQTSGQRAVGRVVVGRDVELDRRDRRQVTPASRSPAKPCTRRNARTRP